VANSGFPPEARTDEQRQEYLDEIFEQDGIRLEMNEVDDNGGYRFIGKVSVCVETNYNFFYFRFSAMFFGARP
jgi:hypothetical protein